MKKLLMAFVISTSIFASAPEGYTYKGVLIDIGRVKGTSSPYVIYVDKEGYLYTEIPSNEIKLDNNVGWSLEARGYDKPVVVYSKGRNGLYSTCDEIYLIRENPKDK